jgi:hypothetical protein
LQARFYVDPATGLPHIHGHEVNENEVIEVMDKPGEDRPGREGARIALGRTASGRYLRVIYVPDPGAGQRVCYHSVRSNWKAPRGVSPAEEEEATMSDGKFPPDWDEKKVLRVLAHYEEQTEEDALAEDEAGVQPSETVMNIPHELVPKVRELIAKRQS